MRCLESSSRRLKFGLSSERAVHSEYKTRYGLILHNPNASNTQQPSDKVHLIFFQ